MTVTLTGSASAIGSRSAPTVTAPAGTDAPSAASNNQPDQGLLDLVASLLAHGGLLDVANTFSQVNTFSKGLIVSPSAVTEAQLKDGNAQTATTKQLRGEWPQASAPSLRLYTVSSSVAFYLQLTWNAAWSGTQWVADDTSKMATSLELGGALSASPPPIAGTYVPGMRPQVKTVTTVAWTNWDAFFKGPSDCTSVHANVTVTSLIMTSLTGRHVHLSGQIDFSGVVAANTTLFTLPTMGFTWGGSTLIKPGIYAAAFGVTSLTIDTSGNVKLPVQAVQNGDVLYFNDVFLQQV